jgi:Tol biopolymer transport system component
MPSYAMRHLLSTAIGVGISLCCLPGGAWDAGPVARFTHSASNSAPSWSPDGSRIAFSSTRDQGGGFRAWTIYVMDADGFNLTALTRDRGPEFDPCWTGDGSLVGFWSPRDGGGGQVRIVDADRPGSARALPSATPGAYPSWSADGSRIAFEAPCGEGSGIYVMNVDGSALTSLTCDEVHQIQPSWSPDGSRIAFTAYAGKRRRPDLHVMNADGSGRARLTRSDGYEGDACWSPDGAWIAFVSGGGDIAAVMEDGTQRTRLTATMEPEGSPSWSPDGTRIAFHSARDNRSHIYVMDVSAVFPKVVAAMARAAEAGASASPAEGADSDGRGMEQ